MTVIKSIASNLLPSKVPFASHASSQQRWGDWFFEIPDSFSRYMDKKNANPHYPPLRRKVIEMGKWFGLQWLEHDYTDVKGIPSLGVGRHVVMPPIGAVAFIVIAMTLAARLHYGIKRSKDNDTRELGDILRRDIPTLGLLVFAQDPLVKTMTQLLQERHGIQLLAKPTGNHKGFWSSLAAATRNHELTYSELDRYYRISHPRRLLNIIRNPINHQGILEVLNEAANKKMTAQQELIFGGFTRHIRHAIRLSKRNSDIREMEPVISKAYGALKQFEHAGLKHRNSLNIRTIFSEYAKTARHGSVFFSLAIIVGLLGYGVAAFNEWWSIRQYKSLLKEEERSFIAKRGH